MGASHTVSGGPPEMSIFLSLPSAKNPTKRLSGDQKGDAAFSVPCTIEAVSPSSERTHNCDFPSAFTARKTICRPSGDTATGAGNAPVLLGVTDSCHESGVES